MYFAGHHSSNTAATKHNLRATNSSGGSDRKANRSLLPVNQWGEKNITLWPSPHTVSDTWIGQGTLNVTSNRALYPVSHRNRACLFSFAASSSHTVTRRRFSERLFRAALLQLITSLMSPQSLLKWMQPLFFLSSAKAYDTREEDVLSSDRAVCFEGGRQNGGRQ